MKMPRNARNAFRALKALGAPVMEWGEKEGYGKHVAFVIIWQNENGTEVFHDFDGQYIREEYINGRYINPGGVRQDVHEVFAKYKLVTDWHTHGQMVVYKDPDAPGQDHAWEAEQDDPPRKMRQWEA